MTKLPKLFNTSKRYSAATKPAVGEFCFFSNAITLLLNDPVPKTKAFLHPWIKQNAVVKVIKNHNYVTEVRFPDSDQTDLVSPEFLIKRELTAFGQAFFDQNPSTMAAHVKKYFLGETHEAG